MLKNELDSITGLEARTHAERTSLEVFTNEVIACQCSNQWTNEIWHYVAEHIKEWYENDFIVRLFNNWSVKRGNFERDLMYETQEIMNGKEAGTLSNYSAGDLDGYNTVIYELLIQGRVPGK